MTLKLVTAPAAEPLTTTEAKNHLRVDISDDDTLIDTLVVVAREHVETCTRRALITQTWDYVLDDWPAGDTIVVPLPRLQSVTSVQYTDKDNVTSTFASSNYAVDTDSEPGRIRLLSGVSWPSDTLYVVNAVRVRFVAGYGAAASNLPKPIRQAMLMLVGHWYENREATLDGAVMREIPFAVEALLWPYRVLRWL